MPTPITKFSWLVARQGLIAGLTCNGIFADVCMSHPELTPYALARIRTPHQIEATAQEQTHGGTALTAYRKTDATPVLNDFAAWLEAHAPRVLAKSKLGEAFTCALNQWPTLTVCVTGDRLAIDNNVAEQALRPIAVSRKIGCTSTATAVLLSMAASAKRHSLNPCDYFRHLLTELPARPPNADRTDLLSGLWAKSRTGPAASNGL